MGLKFSEFHEIRSVCKLKNSRYGILCSACSQNYFNKILKKNSYSLKTKPTKYKRYTYSIAINLMHHVWGELYLELTCFSCRERTMSSKLMSMATCMYMYTCLHVHACIKQRKTGTKVEYSVYLRTWKHCIAKKILFT